MSSGYIHNTLVGELASAPGLPCRGEGELTCDGLYVFRFSLHAREQFGLRTRGREKLETSRQELDTHYIKILRAPQVDSVSDFQERELVALLKNTAPTRCLYRSLRGWGSYVGQRV